MALWVHHQQNESERGGFEETPITPWQWPCIVIYCTEKIGCLDWLPELKERKILALETLPFLELVAHFPSSVALNPDVCVRVPVATALFLIPPGVACATGPFWLSESSRPLRGEGPSQGSLILCGPLLTSHSVFWCPPMTRGWCLLWCDLSYYLQQWAPMPWASKKI